MGNQEKMINMLDCSIQELDECLKKTPHVASSILKHRLQYEHDKVLRMLTEKVEEWNEGFESRIKGQPMTKDQANKLFIVVTAAQRILVKIELMIRDRLGNITKLYGENAK
jgi:hypothetical protein